MDAALLLFLLLALGGGRSKAATAEETPDGGDPPPDEGTDDAPPPPANACGPGGAYLWTGFLAMPPGNAATYGLTQAEYSAAATILTRVENQVYKPDFDTGGTSLCNRSRVQKAAKVALNDIESLAMLAYWKIRNRQVDELGGSMSPHPTVDPALVVVPEQRKQWVALFGNLRKFFAAADKAGQAAQGD